MAYNPHIYQLYFIYCKTIAPEQLNTIMKVAAQMDWKSTIIVRAALDLLAIICALLFVLPLCFLLCGAYTAGCWIAERIRPRTSDASHTHPFGSRVNTTTMSNTRGVTTMAVLPAEATQGTPPPASPGGPVDQSHTEAPAEQLARWMQDLDTYAYVHRVHFTQEQAAHLFRVYQQHQRNVKAPAPAGEGEAEG